MKKLIYTNLNLVIETNINFFKLNFEEVKKLLSEKKY